MAIVLTQYSHGARDRNRYLDREGVIYHFPSNYFKIIEHSIQELGDRRFLYQRPVRGAPEGQSGTYFGYGMIGDPYEDTVNPGHYFVDILNYTPMRTPVTLKDAFGNYFETGNGVRINLQGRSVRMIAPQAYNRILASEGAYSPLQPAISVQDHGIYAPAAAPMDAFRSLAIVPPGTGYEPQGNQLPDPYEAAALHERARRDHQEALRLFVESVHREGGVCFFNNNIDLFAKIGERRLLVEAKSLTRQSSAVNRMRYGMGQLMDYGVRYRAELQGAEPVLAFGSPPDREVGWIPEILQANNIAFVANIGGALQGQNDLGSRLPIF